MPEIKLKNVAKRFGKFVAVDNLNLDIESNAFITLLGPSGCGKTTTLRMIAGLETPTEGQISIDGKVVFDADKGINLPPNKRDVGFLFQNYALWPHMTVYQNIAFGLENLKWDKARIRARADELLKMLRIEQFEKRYPAELSGGQQQRVAIARTLAPGPKVLFMDEPLSNLDAKLRMEMRTELKRLHKDTDSTFVYVTHDQLEAMTLSTRVCIMENGVLQQYAPPLEMYNEPANLFVADFMGNPTMNFIDATAKVSGNKAEVSFGSVHGTFTGNAPIALKSEKCVLGIRPEFVKITDGEGVRATVYSTLPSGMETTVKLDVNGTPVTAVVFGGVDYAVDSQVSFTFGGKVILFDRENGGKNVAEGTMILG
ncbi:MAG: ABC transporter ATP-binding protein [Clostridia bacterium]|nr:ABC transporter ATP-binding protein [Clostridia bacterium]MBR2287111.1 ABC transporter ATP-binding protein [Clostridia bacterium]